MKMNAAGLNILPRTSTLVFPPSGTYNISNIAISLWVMRITIAMLSALPANPTPIWVFAGSMSIYL